MSDVNDNNKNDMQEHEGETTPSDDALDGPVVSPDDETPVENAPEAEDAPEAEPVTAIEHLASGPLASIEEDPEAVLAMKHLEERRRKRRRSRIIKGIVAAVVVAAAIAVWAALNVTDDDTDQQLVPKVVAAVRDDLTESVNTTGTLKPASIVEVSPEVSGIIESVSMEEGQTVSAGDTLLTIRSKDVEKSLKEAQWGIDKAEHGVEKARTEVSEAEKSRDDAIAKYDDSVKAYNESLERAESAAQEAFDTAYAQAIAAIPSNATSEVQSRAEEAAQESAQAAYDAAYAQNKLQDPGEFDESTHTKAIEAANSALWDAEQSLTEAQNAYDEAQEQADRRAVKAPTSGVILSVSAVEGASVGGASGGTSTTTSEKLAQIADVSSLKVDIEVNEIDIANIAEGQHAKVTFSSFPAIEENATVTSVASIASGASSEGDSGGTSGGGGGVVTFKVETVIEKPDKQLKPGMSANVEIITKEIPNVIIIPTSALSYDDDGTYVNVVAGEDEESLANPEKRKITTGESTKSEVEVTKGLSEGELVLAGTAAAPTDVNLDDVKL